MSIPQRESWDCMIPGPPSRSNGGSADLSTTGLLAFASGSSVVVVETHSMQLVTAIPLPPPPSPSSAALSPFITSVRWSPHPLPHILLSSDAPNQHLVLSVGDRQGRICLLDLRSRAPLMFLDTSSNSTQKLGIQDLCWIQTGLDSWAIAALSGPSLLSIYSTSSGRCFFKYDASPEQFSCLCPDPFDSRRFCAVGLKGFLLSIKAFGDSENDVANKELQIHTDASELQKLERDSTAAVNGSPALATFPNYIVSSAFSPHSKHILFVAFPRELVVFDLQYEATLYSAGLPRGCGKFLQVLPDSNMEVLYCAHLDGMISIWQRKKGEQVYTISAMEELMPSLGSYVPPPSVLGVVICHSDAILQNISKLCSDGRESSELDFDNPFDFCDESLIISKTPLISISDDGKVWKWLLTAEGSGSTQKAKPKPGTAVEVHKSQIPEENPQKNIFPSDMLMKSNAAISNSGCVSNASKNDKELFKISLVGQLHLLSSPLSMLAVPSPSLTGTLARGGNFPAVAVPLVALGTQNGSIEVIDVYANAVAASFSVHNSVIRGLRWLGNSRLVSFSYTQRAEKSSGYVNRLVVTCLRSGLNRSFRVLQKPERAPIRALRVSSSGRYLLILFRDAPVEVWAMTKTPVMLRSLALPFTVVEWSLPTVPRPSSKDRTTASVETSSPKGSPLDSKSGTDEPQDEFSECFSFALANGALGVFEVQGRRIRDFRPKWPSSSFAASDGLVTAMAYRLPHVVLGDRSGNIRWWDVNTGQSSSFNTHREGVRRIKFSPVVPGDRSRGRIAVLFYDNTFSVYDLDSPDPLANSLLQPQLPGTLVLELDWLPLRTDKNDPLILCIAGADSSFRLLEVNINDNKRTNAPAARLINERYRPVPLFSPILLPTAHAMAMRTILQLGLKPSWFNTFGPTMVKGHYDFNETPSSTSDLCSYMLHSSCIGDSVVPEMLLKVLEPYRREGCILDNEMVRLYCSIVNKGCVVRLAFAAALFGEPMEALFWLQLPDAINHWMKKLVNKSPIKVSQSATQELDEATMLNRISSKGKTASESQERNEGKNKLRLMAFEEEGLLKCAKERILWHEKLEGEEAIQNRVHELVSVGNLEAAVSLLLSTPPDSSYFYANALRAVALSSAVSQSLLELAVKVVAANMVRTDNSLSGTHLLCAVGRYQEACSQLQDAACWTDAATLAASHLQGSDYARVLQRWADHVLSSEHDIWRALVLYVAAGAFQEALAALREAQQPDTAAMFILACRETHAELLSGFDIDDKAIASVKDKLVSLPGLSPESDDAMAVVEYYGQYQRKLVHLCMDSPPFFD
ncbi:unnamed protein product [Cuscuta campestris]|uniref:Uncharacterized protein n=1 Tax=Cuscuta campestris TaxID=132261 RepID=A0A484KY51_9ASTE|nr:unnamed protein product [Cuscuta campestris]